MRPYVLTNGILLSGHRDMVPMEGLNIFVLEGKIEKICKEANFAGYQVIDLQQQYILPGLINLHVHLPGSGKPKMQSGGDMKKLVNTIMSLPSPIRNAIGALLTGSGARKELYSGVTTVRCVGGVGNFDSLARNQINAGKRIGPRLLVADQAIAPIKGHMTGSVAVECKTKEEALAALEKITAGKPDLIKLMITGGVLDAEKPGEPGALKMDPEMVRICCEAAHKKGLPVAAHTESAAGVRVALENGVDTIEHGAPNDAETLRLYKERHAALVATLSPALPYALFDRSLSGASELEQANGKIVFEGIIQSAIQCLAEGIPVGLGTDTGCPYITHYDMWREIAYFVKYCHVTPAFALHTATLVNAQIAGIDKITGSIDAGKSADMMIVKENPLENLTVLRKAETVIFKGKIYPHPAIKKYPKCEAVLDRYL